MILHSETLVYDGREECEGIKPRPLARTAILGGEELSSPTLKQRAATRKLSRQIARPPRHKLDPLPFNNPRGIVSGERRGI